MLVQQILKSKGDDGVLTIKPGTLVSEAAQILAERRIGGLVVSRDGEHAEGILSERDIVRALAVRGATCLTEKVDEMMTRNPVCCSRQDSSDAVLSRMTDGRFRHMPVVEDGKLVGIVTIGDVVKARLQELSMEKDALEGMIMGY
ncbi:CBS domain protein [Roseovarius halotolerans]|uniref:Hypoxic response protein 1 n=1 Tax=Roseovarius halotolerans TaxID=505353 RepID=A0A1X6YID2_9RHOB|nr:CBS domain-containing protein [Roseovarius halotolerans]RKT34532.1 CBS domain protein [Roseovarius halotolerans]SLN22243.1 Hypoxic response protein 1 [Roseovarius halotolerans]